MRVIVLGAGVTGVTSAWYLNRAGHEVVVVDRQSEAASETSFANGGQISVSHAEPWANPSAPLKVLQWLGKEDAPLLFRLRADMRQWLWGLSFLRNCTPARTRHNIEQIVRLGTYSRDTLQQLRAFFHRVLYQRIGMGHCLGIDERAHVRFWLEAVAHTQGGDVVEQVGGKGIHHAVLHQKAVGADAGLPGIAKLAAHGHGHGLVHVGIVKNNKGGVAAQFHAKALERCPALGCQLQAHSRGAGKAQFAYDVIFTQRCTNNRRISRQDLEYACGQTCFESQYAECKCTQRR